MIFHLHLFYSGLGSSSSFRISLFFSTGEKCLSTQENVTVKDSVEYIYVWSGENHRVTAKSTITLRAHHSTVQLVFQNALTLWWSLEYHIQPNDTKYKEKQNKWSIHNNEGGDTEEYTRQKHNGKENQDQFLFWPLHIFGQSWFHKNTFPFEKTKQKHIFWLWLSI